MILFCCALGQAQNRISDKNNIAWLNINSTFTITNHFGIQAEYHMRRVDYLENWQQGLLRLGLNCTLNPETNFRLGYGWAETYAYGDIPINGMGKQFTEHRIFEMVQLNSKLSKLAIAHRFMLEQRWVGRYSNTSLEKEDSYSYVNRLRYQIRLQLPLYEGGPYAAVYDELFCGFGGNIGENIFDQNRFGALLGYQFTKSFRAEGGYLNQIIQLGREVGGKNVFQKNNGFIVSGIFNFDFRKTNTLP